MLACLALTTSAFGAVKVVSTFPQAGSKSVNAAVKQIKIRFSEPVNTGDWSLVDTNLGLPLETTGMPSFSESDTVCTVPVVLYPGMTYSVSINSERFTNFRSAKDPNVAVTPYMLTFTTAGKKPTGKAAEVTVVSTFPQAGATDVASSTREVKVRFSGPVNTTGWSLVTTDFGAELPVEDRPSFSEGNVLCTIPVKLKPNTKYAVSINSDRFNNFRNAKNPEVPVKPYLLVFTTAAGTKKSQTEQWHEDLQYLAQTLPKRHKNLFFKISKEEFGKSVADLDSQITKLQDYQFRAGLLKIVAAVGDPHTGIDIWKDGKFARLPLGLYWFKDGIYVVSASEEYKQSLGRRLQGIGDVDIQKACDAVAPFIAHANEYQMRKVAPMFLLMPDLLKAAGVVSDTSQVVYRFDAEAGSTGSIAVKPVEADADTKWLDARDRSKTKLPLYLSRKPCPNWVEYVKDGNLVYFHYANCYDAKECPFAAVSKEVKALVAGNAGAKLVIDLRQNGGGSSPVLDPFIDWVKGNSEINTKGRLFVIIGRRTFSSAILNADRLKEGTRAIFVGEPTGGSPNHYGQVMSFELPNTGFSVSYSIKYFHYLDTDKTSLEPDILAEQAFDDYVSGRDPAMEAIRKYQ